jgi:hypothetical protein
MRSSAEACAQSGSIFGYIELILFSHNDVMRPDRKMVSSKGDFLNRVLFELFYFISKGADKSA